MSKRNSTEKRIAFAGKVIIWHLERARRMLIGLPFHTVDHRNDARERAAEIRLLILLVGGLCCTDSRPEAVRDYLISSGIELPKDFVDARRSLEESLGG